MLIVNIIGLCCRPHSIGVDRCGRELRVAEPALHEVERNARLHRCHTHSCRKPLGEAESPVRSASSITSHTLLQAVVLDHVHRRTPAPRSARLWRSRTPWTLSRSLRRLGGTSDGAKDSPPSLLERFEDERAGGEVHAVNGERERFGEAAPREREDGAQGLNPTLTWLLNSALPRAIQG